jgi:hypothetical protein
VPDSTTDEDARVAALSALDLLDTAPEERFDRVTRLCTRLFGVSMAAVTLVDRRRTWVKSGVGMPRDVFPREESFCNVAVQHDGQTVVPDAREDPRFAQLELVTGPEQLRFYAGAPLRAPSGERVGVLCLYDPEPKRLSPAEQALLDELAAWVQDALVEDEEMDRAAEVQRDLLPDRPGEIPGYQLVGTCVTSRHVGGDLYDWYDMGGGTALTVADVMGKGLGAAIVMASLRSVLRAATRYRGVQAAVLTASEALQSDFERSGTFATLFHAVLEPDTGSLHYVDAGHGLALLVRADGSTTRTSTSGLPVGVLPDQRWAVHDLVLAPGDTLVVYSDGLLDLHADRAALDRQVLEAVQTGGSVAGVLEHLTWAVRRIKQPDDVTVVVLRREG